MNSSPLVLLVLAALALPSTAQNVRLSGPLARAFPGGPIAGDVAYFLPPSSGLVVYLADQDVDGVAELYSARLDGRGAPRRLTAALGTAGTVGNYATTSPDGTSVVFQHHSTGGVARLYAVSARGTTDPVLLDESADGAFPAPFLVGAGGTRVVYRKGRAGHPGAYDLYSVPLDASDAPVRLNPAWPTLQHRPTVHELALAPDGATALFRANPTEYLRMELFAVPVDGSAPSLRLSGDLDLTSFRIAPDGRNVLYVGSGATNAVGNLHTAALDGGRPPEQLSTVRPDGLVAEYQITSDGRRVVFNARRGVFLRYRLYSAPADGRRPPIGVPGGSLRRAPLLLTPLGDDAEVLPGSLRLTPDGAQVVYLADALVDGFHELYRVRTDGSSAPVPLDPPLAADERVGSFEIAPEGAHLVYRVEAASGPAGLFRIPVAGGAVLDYGARSVGDPVQFQVAPDSLHVFFVAETGAGQELFAVPFDASAPPRRLNSPLPAGGGVSSSFVPLPGGRVLYVADQAEDDVFELFEGFAGRTLPASR
ncbi:MAG TPA: hypothetical protein VF530_08940 [Planctomycetota bacterium]